MPEGGEGDGEGDEDGEGAEVQVQPPHPNPVFYPLPSGCKRLWERLAAPLPLGLPKSLNRALGQTNKFFVTRARVTTPCVGSSADFFWCLIRKNGAGKGEWRRDAAKGGA